MYFSASAAREHATTGTVSSRTLNLGALWSGFGFAHHHILVFLGIRTGCSCSRAIEDTERTLATRIAR